MLFLNVSATVCAMDRDYGAVTTAIERELAQRGWANLDLAREAGVDVKTIRSLLNGERWPHRGSRSKIEAALGWEVGAIESVAKGGRVEHAEQRDPVYVAVENSGLTRGRQFKLLGYYEELREDQAAAESRGA